MIAFKQALQIALDHAFSCGSVQVPAEQSVGRVILTAIHSDIDMPPFDKSAVDGFACRQQDIKMELKVVETLAAGSAPQHAIGMGECSRIMTGAPIPQGADCVVMVENSREETKDLIRFDIEKTAPNICYQGEDVRKGDLLIPSGTLINAGHVPIMAAAGYAEVEVATLPRIAVISTGDELVEPAEKPAAAQIRNSNAYQLIAQAAALGCKAKYFGIAKDNEEETLDKIRQALNESDVVLLTGGVSMGDFDFVPAMMEKAGLSIAFRKIAIQPGKPTVLAHADHKLCFGLPGNPVSSFVLFEFLVKPVLYRMQGCDYQSQIFRLPLACDFKRRRADRMNVVPVTIKDGNSVDLVNYHGSAHIHAMSYTRGFICVPEGVSEIKQGTIVDVRSL